MAEKAPPQPPPDQNVLVYVSEYQNVALQTSINSRKPVYYRNFDTSVSEQVRPVTVESICTSSSSSDHVVDNEHSEYKPDSISPPYGWKRLLSNGIIIYVSPSKTALSSLEQVKSYVESEGTCKCGLECPLHLAIVFNFDPKVITKPCAPPLIGQGDLTKLCNHKRKLLASLENVHGDNRLEGLRRRKRRMVVGPAGVMGSARVTPPLAPPPRPDTGAPFLKVQQQVPNEEVWRDSGYTNGFVDYSGGSGLAPVLSQGAVPGASALQSQAPPLVSHMAKSTVVPNGPASAQPLTPIQCPSPALPTSLDVHNNLLTQVVQQNSLVQGQQMAQSSVMSGAGVQQQLQQAQQQMQQAQQHMQQVQLGTHLQGPQLPQGPLVQQAPPFQQLHQVPHGDHLQSHMMQQLRPAEQTQPVQQVPQLPQAPSLAHGQSASQPLPHCQTVQQQSQPLTDPQPISQGSPVQQVLPGVSMVQASNGPHSHLRRFPPSIAPPQQTCQPPPYHLHQQQMQYENSRAFPPAYGIKYGAKNGSNVQQHSVSNHQQNSASHIQNIQTVSTSYQQSSHQHMTTHQQNINTQQQVMTSQHVSNQQIVSNHQQSLGSMVHSVGGQNVTEMLQSNHPQISHSGMQQGLPNQQEAIGSSMTRVRTPPWHQNKQQASDRGAWSKKTKAAKEDGPSFLEDPSGYLAQQTALLRQAVAGREEEEPRTMASGHTASSNTLTSVLAGRTNTLTVSVGSQEPLKPQHILVSGNGQFIIAAAPKVSPPSPLLLPAPLLLQPIDTVQLPQLVVPPVIHEDLVDKRKSPNKKRKLSPTTSTAMLLSPQPQQQVLTILPSKSPITNMLQPLNVVQNIPIQQFLVPSMVMSDGTILQDTVQLNLLPSAGMFSSGQNLLAPAGVVLRAPTSQPQQQQTKFLHSPNQFVGFSGELSPVVPNTSNTTVVQQNTTTIVQQTTMVQQPSPSYILDKPNFILTSDKHNFILSPSSEKVRGGFVRNSVSTQTQNQVVQVSSSGGLVVATGGSRGSSPPDTTTLSPADHEVTTSVTSPDPSMVHCVSSTNLHDDTSPYIDTTTSIPYSSGNIGKRVSYVESSSSLEPLQDKDITHISSDDYSSKIGLSSTTDSSQLASIQDSE